MSTAPDTAAIVLDASASARSLGSALLPCQCGCGDVGVAGIGERHRVKDATDQRENVRALLRDIDFYRKLFSGWLVEDWMPESAKVIYREALEEISEPPF